MTMLNDDDIALAGEYVLRLLDAATEVSVAARISTDRDFASEVEAWRLRLQPMLTGADTPPPPSTWPAIMAALPPATGQQVTKASVRLWQGLAGLSTAAAAVLAVIVLQQRDPVIPPAAAPPLIAALGSETGNASITASYDPASGTMLLLPVSLDTGALYPELWVVPTDGQARSLGIVRGDVASKIAITPEMQAYINKGATLAITPEPQGGAPGGKATGPIIASGKITTV
jgi:anti-sigma-K factor RskA